MPASPHRAGLLRQGWFRVGVVCALVVVAIVGTALAVRDVQPGSRRPSAQPDAHKPLAGSREHVSQVGVKLLGSSEASPTTAPRAGVNAELSGWALTTQGLQVTYNGGTSFSIVTPPIRESQIADVAVSGTEITVVGANPGVQPTRVWITQSSDRGSAWSALASISLPPTSRPDREELVSSNGSLIGMLVTTISPPSSWAVWVPTADDGSSWGAESKVPVGGVVTAAGSALWLVSDTAQRLFRSTDAGQEWTAVTVPSSDGGAAFNLAGALSTGRVVLVADTPNSSTGAPKVDVLTTMDGGLSWQVLSQSSFPGMVGGNVPMSASVVSESVWIGSGSAPDPLVVASTGKITVVSSPAGVSGVDAISASSSSSAWATFITSGCPSGKSSCSSASSLGETTNNGASWRSARFAAGPAVS